MGLLHNTTIKEGCECGHLPIKPPRKEKQASNLKGKVGLREVNTLGQRQHTGQGKAG